MRRAFKYLFGALVIVILAVGGLLAWYVLSDDAPPKPTLSATGPTGAGGPATPNGPWHVVRKPGVFVGYRIKELFGDSVLKHTVVGRTPAVSGRLTVANGRVANAAVTADLRELESDRAARDTYIHDNALESAQYPTGRFTLTTPVTLPAPVERGRKVRTRVTGRLLLHGVTKPVTFELEARWSGPTIQVVGSAPVVLDDFGIDAPNTVIADVDDEGSIELDLVFAPGAG